MTFTASMYIIFNNHRWKPSGWIKTEDGRLNSTAFLW